MNAEENAKMIMGLISLIVYVVNLVKLFQCALSDQLGLAIVHGVGLLFPITLITVWF